MGVHGGICAAASTVRYCFLWLRSIVWALCGAFRKVACRVWHMTNGMWCTMSVMPQVTYVYICIYIYICMLHDVCVCVPIAVPIALNQSQHM